MLVSHLQVAKDPHIFFKFSYTILCILKNLLKIYLNVSFCINKFWSISSHSNEYTQPVFIDPFSTIFGLIPN